MQATLEKKAGIALMTLLSKRQARNVHQVIVSNVEAHSKKPDEARRRIEALMGDVPRVELFARQHPPGWDVRGNEAPDSIHFGKERVMS